MIVAPSLTEPHIWYVFDDNGDEHKLLFDGDNITVITGYLSPSKQQIALEKIKETI